MKKHRILSFLVSIGVILSASRTPAKDPDPTPPPATMLQSGDLIWPKRPGALVFYDSRLQVAEEGEAARWEREKEKYLKGILGHASPLPEEKERYAALRNMNYEDFVDYYLSDQLPGKSSAFGWGAVEVGHVAIVQIKEGEPYIIEAMWGPGVQRLPYTEWTKVHQGEIIWVGRLKEVSAEVRATVGERAADQIGKPYDFWRFDLMDTSGFYCSKLAWLAIKEATGSSPDGNDNPKRILWYSPKQLLTSERVQLIVNPGDYGSR